MKYDMGISLHEVVKQPSVSSKPAVTVKHRHVFGSHSGIPYFNNLMQNTTGDLKSLIVL